VVCPDADIKFYVIASDEIRAQRRHKELLDRGKASIYARVLQDLKERDARDSERSVAPMKPVKDAVVLDTTVLDAEAAYAAAMKHISGIGAGNPAEQ
jgi:cytidylate kinase